MKIIGDVPWSKMSYDTDIARAMTDAYDAVQHPARRAGALPVDPRRLLAGVSVLEPGRRPARRAGVDADRDGRRRPRRQRPRGQRVLHHRRRREGLRHGRRGEGRRRRSSTTSPARTSCPRRAERRPTDAAAPGSRARQDLSGRRRRGARAARRHARHRGRRVRRRRRTVGFRQVDVHAHPRLPRSADDRASTGSTAATSRG